MRNSQKHVKKCVTNIDATSVNREFPPWVYIHNQASVSLARRLIFFFAAGAAVSGFISKSMFTFYQHFATKTLIRVAYFIEDGAWNGIICCWGSSFCFCDVKNPSQFP